MVLLSKSAGYRQTSDRAGDSIAAGMPTTAYSGAVSFPRRDHRDSHQRKITIVNPGGPLWISKACNPFMDSGGGLKYDQSTIQN